MDTTSARLLPSSAREIGILNDVKNFWSVLWSGEWAANVLVPLVVAALALAFAVYALRTQLQSDRNQARAQYRQGQAQRFAQVLDATSEKFERLVENLQPGGFAIPPDGGRDHIRRLTHPLEGAARRAETTFGQHDLISTVHSSIFNAGPRVSWWVNYGEAKAARGEEQRADTLAATGYVLQEYAALWRAFAHALDAWNGEGEFPPGPPIESITFRVSSLRSNNLIHLNKNMVLHQRTDADRMRFDAVLATCSRNRLGETA